MSQKPPEIPLLRIKEIAPQDDIYIERVLSPPPFKPLLAGLLARLFLFLKFPETVPLH